VTLCVAWIREVNDTQELVFATDSSLTGGEKWNQGIKLFELPRTDCLICFAGNTGRAYPLILNLMSSINLNRRLQSPRTDIFEVLEYLQTLFSSLVSTIIDERKITDEDVHDLRSDVQFLFGGWSWLENRFRIWRLYYAKDAEGFVPHEYTEDASKTRQYVFLGNPSELGDTATKQFKDDLYASDKLDSRLDMEPLKVLIDMARDKSVREVDGSVQIAKIYRSGTSEFFGVHWPSVAGKPHFQGREFHSYNKPAVRYLDPDTLEILEDELPGTITDMTLFESIEEFEFVKGCYDEAGSLKVLSERDRERLLVVFREIAYLKFVEGYNKEKVSP
jgi:hypothetical protein